MATEITHTVICVDCGPDAMGPSLASMCEVARTRCEWGLHFGSRPGAGYSNTVSFVLSGTALTKLPASISTESGCYGGIQVALGWEPCTASTVRFWESLRRLASGGEACAWDRGEEMKDESGLDDGWDSAVATRRTFEGLGAVKGDVLDTLVVALAQVQAKRGELLRAAKLSVLLLTTEAPSARDAEQIRTHYGGYMRHHDIELVVGVAAPATRGGAPLAGPRPARRGPVWEAMGQAVEAAVGSSRCETLEAIADGERMRRTATVKPAIRARGELEVAPGFSVDVQMYNYTFEKSQPDPGRFKRVVVDDTVLGASETMLEPDRSVISQTLYVAPPTASREVTVQNVDPSQRVKAYKFGSDLFPVEDTRVLELAAGGGADAAKGWKVLGFLDRDALHVARLVSGVSVVVASKGAVLDAGKALRALVAALHSEGKVAVVRQAVGRGENKVEIGVLWPHEKCSTDPTLGDVLFYARLPFEGEDRRWAFPSFVKAGVTSEQVELAERLIDAHGGLEVPAPHELPSVTGQRFHDHVMARACDGPDAGCPRELPEWLQPRVLPEKFLPPKASKAIAEFASGFEFVQPFKRVKRGKEDQGAGSDWRTM